MEELIPFYIYNKITTMFTLAVTAGVHDKRVIDYLKNQKELQEGEDFIRTPDEGGEGTVNYSFPDMDEDNFRYLV